MTRITAEMTCMVDGNIHQVAAICHLLKAQAINIRKIELLERQTQPDTHYLCMALEYHPDAPQQAAALKHLQQSLQNVVMAFHPTNP